MYWVLKTRLTSPGNELYHFSSIVTRTETGSSPSFKGGGMISRPERDTG